MQRYYFTKGTPENLEYWTLKGPIAKILVGTQVKDDITNWFYATGSSLSVTVEGDIRLVGGSSPQEGRVEIYHQYYSTNLRQCYNSCNPYVPVGIGARFAMMHLLPLTLLLYVASWDIPLDHSFVVRPSSDKEVEQFG